MSQQLPEGMVKRGRTYHADFRAGGRRIRRKLSRNLTTAKQVLIELRARAERGEIGLLDNDVTVEGLKAEYLRDCRQTKKPRTVERYEFNLGAILPHMPARVSLISIQAVTAYRERRLTQGLSPRTVNMDVGALSTMLEWGVTYRIIGSNPLKGLEPLPHDHPKEGRGLDDSEVARLLEASPQRLYDVWYAFLVTGMRQTELISLRFADVDWQAREVIVQRGIAKNHTPRRIPIDNGLWEILSQRREGRDDQARVFTNVRGGALSRGPVYRCFIRCCHRAGIQTRTVDGDGHEIDHVDVHSLRKTFATNLIVNGTDPKTVQELLGHKTLAMTMNLYTKIHTGTKRQGVGRLSYGKGSETPDHVIEFRAG